MSDPFAAFPVAPAAAQTDDPFAAFPAAPPTTTVAPVVAEAPPEERSMVDQIMGGLDYAGQTAGIVARGARKGVANLIGLPVDLVNLALSATGLPTSAQPVGGSESLDNLFGGFGLTPEPEPQDSFQRIAGRIGEEIGAAGVPAAGALVGAARMGVQGARTLAESGPTILHRMFGRAAETAALAPREVLVRELPAATVAGAGAGLGREAALASGYGEDDTATDLADLFGAVSGLTMHGLLSGVVDAAGQTVRALAPRDSTLGQDFSNDTVRDVVTDRVAAASGLTDPQGKPVDTEPLAAQITYGNRVGDAIPGFQETLGDRTGLPGVLNLERNAEIDPASAAAFIARRSDNTAAVDAALASNAPNANPGAFSGALRDRRDELVSEFETAESAASLDARDAAQAITPTTTPEARGSTIRTALDEELERALFGPRQEAETANRRATEATDALRPGSDPEARGNTVRVALQQAEDEANAAVTAAYQRAEVEGATVDASRLKAALDAVDSRLTEAERALVPRNVIDRVRGLAEPAEPTDTGLLDEYGQAIMRDPTQADVSLREATSLRTILLEMQRKFLSDPRAESGGRNAARVVNQYVQALEGVIDDVLPADQREALTTARTLARQRADAFGRQGDPVAAALATREGGRPQVGDARVTGTFVQPGQAQPLDRLFAQADTPEVRAAIEDEILSRIPPGPRTPEALERFVGQYEVPLRSFPGLQARIDTAIKAQRDAATAKTAVDTRRTEFVGASPGVSRTLDRRSDGSPQARDEQVPGQFVRPGAAGDLDALLSRADTPEVRAAIEDEILARFQNVAPDQLPRRLDQYGPALDRFSGLRDQIQKAATDRIDGETAAETARMARAFAVDPRRSGVANYLEYGDENATRAMQSVLSARDPAARIDELLRFVDDDPQAVEGARRAFWDVMQGRSRRAGETTRDPGSGAQPWMPEALSRFLDDPANAAVAERLWRDNPEHLARVRQIAEALRTVDLRHRAKVPNTSGTAQDLLPSVESLQSRVFAVLRGQVGVPYLVSWLATSISRRAVQTAEREAINRMTGQALLNPDFAAELLRQNNPANRAALRRSLRFWLGNQASTLIDVLDESDEEPDEEPDELMGAIMR